MHYIDTSFASSARPVGWHALAVIKQPWCQHPCPRASGWHVLAVIDHPTSCSPCQPNLKLWSGACRGASHHQAPQSPLPQPGLSSLLAIASSSIPVAAAPALAERLGGACSPSSPTAVAAAPAPGYAIQNPFQVEFKPCYLNYFRGP